jgi:hypothetical protein
MMHFLIHCIFFVVHYPVLCKKLGFMVRKRYLSALIVIMIVATILLIC